LLTAAPPHTTAPPSRAIQVLALIALLLYAFTLRAWRINEESLWYDEIVSVENLDEPTFQGFLDESRAHDPPLTPFYFWLEYGVYHMAGESILALRILSLVLSMAALLTLFFFTRSVFGFLPAWIATLCFSAANLHIFHAQGIRMYSLIPLLALIAMIAIRAAITRRSLAFWAVNVGCNILLLWTHLLCALLPLAQGLYLLWYYRSNIRTATWWTIAHLFGIVPLLFWLMTVDRTALDKFNDPAPMPIAWKIFDTLCYSFPWSDTNIWQHLAHPGLVEFLHTLLGFSMCFALAVAIARHIGGKTKSTNHQETMLLLTWLLVPLVALPLVILMTKNEIFSSRYILYSCLPLYILFGKVVADIRSPKRRWLTVATVVLVYVLLNAQVPRPIRGDWKSLTNHIKEQGAADEPIVTAAHTGAWPLSYYLDRSREDFLYDPDDPARRVFNKLQRDERVWVVAPGDGEEFEREMQVTWADYTSRHFPSGTGLTLYAVTRPTPPEEDDS
jgi:4-amino-4-deoxy-L-arabinose transferase-like glycosyltransferase